MLDASIIYTHFFNLSTDISCVTDTEGKLVHLSDSWTSLLGYTLEESLQKNIFDFIHPKDTESTQDRFLEIKAGDSTVNFENRYQHKEGHYLFLSWSISPDIQNGLYYGIAKNITEQKRMREKLEMANEELEAFSYAVSHDLRAPLRSIESWSSVFEEDYAQHLDETGLGYLGFLREGATQMRRLIDALLELSRVSNKKLDCEDVNLSDLIEELLATLQQENPNVNIQTKIEPNLSVEGDPALLKRMLGHLLDNAYKFRKKELVCEICFGRKMMDGQPTFFVADKGVGFEEAYAKEMFRTFKRLHSAKEFKGEGVGLSIVQRIIRQHSGKIWAKGEVNKGATFYFMLDQ